MSGPRAQEGANQGTVESGQSARATRVLEHAESVFALTRLAVYG